MAQLYAAQLLSSPVLRTFWKASTSPGATTVRGERTSTPAGGAAGPELALSSTTLRIKRSEALYAAAHVPEAVELVKRMLKAQISLVQPSQLLLGFARLHLRASHLLQEDCMHALVTLSGLGSIYIPLHPPSPSKLAAGPGQTHKRKRGAAEQQMVLEEDEAVARNEDITLPEEEDYLLGVPDFSLHTPLGAAQAPLLSPIRSASLSAAATSAGAGGGAGLPGSQGRSASLAAAAASPAGRGRGPLLASITPGVAAGGEEMFEEAEEEVLAGSQGLLGVELVWTGAHHVVTTISGAGAWDIEVDQEPLPATVPVDEEQVDRAAASPLPAHAALLPATPTAPQRQPGRREEEDEMQDHREVRAAAVGEPEGVLEQGEQQQHVAEDELLLRREEMGVWEVQEPPPHEAPQQVERQAGQQQPAPATGSLGQTHRRQVMAALGLPKHKAKGDPVLVLSNSELRGLMQDRRPLLNLPRLLRTTAHGDHRTNGVTMATAPAGAPAGWVPRDADSVLRGPPSLLCDLPTPPIAPGTPVPTLSRSLARLFKRQLKEAREGAAAPDKHRDKRLVAPGAGKAAQHEVPVSWGLEPPAVEEHELGEVAGPVPAVPSMSTSTGRGTHPAPGHHRPPHLGPGPTLSELLAQADLVPSVGELLDEQMVVESGTPALPPGALKGGAAAVYASLPRRTQHVATYLKKEFQRRQHQQEAAGEEDKEELSVGLDDLVTGHSRMAAARWFTDVLSLQTCGLVTLSQDTPFGRVLLYPRDELLEATTTPVAAQHSA